MTIMNRLPSLGISVCIYFPVLCMCMCFNRTGDFVICVIQLVCVCGYISIFQSRQKLKKPSKSSKTISLCCFLFSFKILQMPRNAKKSSLLDLRSSVPVFRFDFDQNFKFEFFVIYYERYSAQIKTREIHSQRFLNSHFNISLLSSFFFSYFFQVRMFKTAARLLTSIKYPFISSRFQFPLWD